MVGNKVNVIFQGGGGFVLISLSYCFNNNELQFSHAEFYSIYD